MPGYAIDVFKQGLDIAREIGDRRGEGATLGNLGVAYKNLGEYDLVIEYYEKQLTLFVSNALAVLSIFTGVSNALSVRN